MTDRRNTRLDWPGTAALLGYADTHEMFEALYVRQGLSIATLAKKFGVSERSCAVAITQAGVAKRRQGMRRNPNPPFDAATLVEIKLAREAGITLMEQARRRGLGYWQFWYQIHRSVIRLQETEAVR